MSELEENTVQQEMPQEPRTEFIAPAIQDEPQEPAKCENKKNFNCGMIHWIVEGVLLLAVIALFILHFCGGKCGNDAEGTTATNTANVVSKPGNGNIIYINLDTVYECNLWKEKQAILDEESEKLEATFTARQKKLEADAAQFQKNMQSGVLTEPQMQYAYQQLEEADQKIKMDYQTAVEALAKKQADMTEEMIKTLRETAISINNASAKTPASYVITYSSSNPTVIVTDPSRDITKSVIAELDKKCSKSDAKNDKKSDK